MVIKKYFFSLLLRGVTTFGKMEAKAQNKLFWNKREQQRLEEEKKYTRVSFEFWT
jgi:hypothetical protein